MDVVYLDNNATTRPAPEVVAAMTPYLHDLWGNPSSAHRFGQAARQGIDIAREQIAGVINSRVSELIFTGGGTEATNTALRGFWLSRSAAGKKRIVTSAVEHSATKETVQTLASLGAEVVLIGVGEDGLLDMEAFREAVNDETAFVTTLWANNETGVLFDVKAIAEICREKDVPYHCDLTQCVGKIPTDVAEIGCDAATIASHKFHGPKGVGALFLRRGMRVSPLLIGGPQERSRRGGTENVPGIVGMGKAAELAKAHLSEMEKVRQLRDHLENSILELIPDTRVNGSREHRLPNTSNIGFAHLSSEMILMALSEQGICASAGAACSSGSLEPSHVMKAMNVPEVYAHGSLRFSLSRYSTRAEVDTLIAVLPDVVDRLRTVLPIAGATR